MDGGWTSVYFSTQLHKVEIVKAVLEDNDIKSVSIDKRDSSYIGIGEIEIFVRAEDVILAKIIIQENSL